MVSQQRPQPALLGATRRFGRCEPFRRFDHLSSGHASVGTRSIGKMTVDCQFLFKKSKWGVLGDGQVPAGIIYLDLNFGPPQDYRVKSATVTITLDERDKSIHPFKRQSEYHSSKSGFEVQMTNLYGPKQLVGQMRNAHVKRTVRMVPEVNILGHGAGGLGVDKEKAFTCSSRWNFNGQILPGKGTTTYKVLRWELTENGLQGQTFRSSRIHTAFALQHAEEPFLMKVEIEGKLETWDRLKSKMKFFSRTHGNNGHTTTLINFDQRNSHKAPLDYLANSLPRAMELANYEEIPVEIPDTMQTSFQPAPPGNSQPFPDGTGTLQSDNRLHQQTLGGNTDLPPAGAPPIAIEQAQPLPIMPNQTEPDLENLRRVIQPFSHPTAREIILEAASTDFFPSSSDTEVGEIEDEPVSTKMVEEKVKSSLSNPSLDEETMARILQVPVLLAFLQLVARLMGILGDSPRKTKKDKS